MEARQAASEVIKHKKDNKSILTLLGYGAENEWPSATLIKNDLTIWSTNITNQIDQELGMNWKTHLDSARAYYDNATGLTKNPLVVSRALESGWKSNIKSSALTQLSESIVKFAKSTVSS